MICISSDISTHTHTAAPAVRLVLGGAFVSSVFGGGLTGGQNEETAERVHPPGDTSADDVMLDTLVP